MNKTREEVRLLIGALRDLTANQPPLPGIYPDYSAPIARVENGERIIANARWGLPSPADEESVEVAQEPAADFPAQRQPGRCAIIRPLNPR